MHLDRQRLIWDSQHGYVLGNLSSQISFVEVAKKDDKGKAVDVIGVDFSKAFGKVPHSKMLWKVDC